MQKILPKAIRISLNVCVNYGGRQEIVKVAKELVLKSISEINPNEINEELFNSQLYPGINDPELLIRTSEKKDK